MAVNIELLYLMDCPYCLQTKQSIQEAIKESNIKATVKERVIKENEGIASPTILINGKDIQDIILTKKCDACSAALKRCIKCRTYKWEGKAYKFPPKEMIKQAIAKVTA